PRQLTHMMSSASPTPRLSSAATRAIAGALFLFPEEQASRTRVAKINFNLQADRFLIVAGR
ncbi:MAG TPA: hypothetical protein VE860_02990, partial [Chthoniobacterales bacterium]|nr:hypothetical protein [Chthoniobacterales bacterium]